MTTSITKAVLEQQLADALARIAELEAAAPAQPETPSRAHLQQAIWLPRGTIADLLEGGQLRRGVTRKGDTWVTIWGAQYASTSQDGERRYGAGKSLVAFGQPADDLLQVLAGSDRLVAISAYEEPSKPREGDYRRFSDWKVVEVRAIPRTTPAQPVPAQAAPVAAGYGEPTEDEIPF
jgi:hypothetical protein